jgi:hypothetical protein
MVRSLLAGPPPFPPAPTVIPSRPMRTPATLAFSLFTALGLAACGSTVTVGNDDWQLVASGAEEAFTSVGGTSASDVWIVGGDSGKGPAVYHYDGTDWERLTTGTSGSLWWVHAVPGGAVYMAGAGGTILKYAGETFTRMATPGLGASTVFGVWGTADDDLWAVGSVLGREGFVWRFDGESWREVSLPETLPRPPSGENPGLFKVWGDGADTVWISGGRGTLLRSSKGAALELVATGTTASIFTVHGSLGAMYAVGGESNGVILTSGAGGSIENAAPSLAPLLQGVYSAADGTTFASGSGGALYRRRGAAWDEVDTGLAVNAESLHAVWIDPSGGVWAVGGDVISGSLKRGAVVHLGSDVPPLFAPAPADAGTDADVPSPACPETQVDPAPGRSMARRWNEQILGAIRRDIPRPGVHARNLFHLSAAMWDAWAAYDADADGYVVHEKTAITLDETLDDQRGIAISYAAYRLLKHRYANQVGGGVSVACFDAFMDKLGLDPEVATDEGDDATALGNRIGARYIAEFASDGANEAMNYGDTTGWMTTNTPLFVDTPGATMKDPSHWQPLNLAAAVTQNGIPEAAGPQSYIGAQWGLVRPFALARTEPGVLYHDPGAAPAFGDPGMNDWVVDVIRRESEMDTTDDTTIDLSPGAYGNNPLGTNDGTGHPVNPLTGEPYAPAVTLRSDFGRVLAEFWADGPRSETPPGHWDVLANEVADSPDFARKYEGAGPTLSPLEWDVKMYFTLNGALHDAAITAWEIKRKFTCSRPISLIRYKGSLGQSSNPAGLAYHPDGLPLVPGLIEVVTAQSSAAGERHAGLGRFTGQIVVRGWRGEPGDRSTQFGGVAWIRAKEWMPYQRRTFVTPAFPGFTSGHSTFSRAGAEVLSDLTGSPYFPGGLGEFVAKKNEYLTFEEGPSTDVRLQWATYFDAADQAGQSRIWGGIHIEPDDFSGRITGHQVGIDAVLLAKSYLDGTARP